MGKKDEKTNVMRLLEEHGAAYEHFSYEGGALDAVSAAQAIGQPPEQLFKTLVTVGKSGGHYVFMLPAAGELDLKKAAKAAGEKAIEMLPQKQLLPLTGYIHGGCSPVGMKKQFPTFIDASAEAFDAICCSAGKVGHMVRLPLSELRKLLPITAADLCKK